MKTVELIYFKECPNVSQTRAQLLRAFSKTSIRPHWQEWEQDDEASPDYAHDYGSPTILVDGKCVTGVVAHESISCCRLYTDSSGGIQGFPSLNAISCALTANNERVDRSHKVGWQRIIAVLPGVGTAMLPAGLCPACWPAYAGVLSAMGLGFLLNTTYLLPLTVGFLLIAVIALAVRARKRRSYWPFVLGLIASVTILVGKFIFTSDVAMYGGIAALVLASIWNAWPAKTGNGACPACLSQEYASLVNESGQRNEVS